ncbi:hypothetical protein L596_021423 [Steinernema carpocapsae]|uniref:F-box domain-containing protein n=1 Tax=Steinernema carpocapsae TaxID=34508 RepID=A0A4U5MIN2_STECR|nr:hypothetical protein L596_021423 [Steinernema carpocapsae]
MEDIQATKVTNRNIVNPEDKEKSLDDVDLLPAEILTRIFHYFDVPTLFHCRKVNRHFNAVAKKVLTEKALIKLTVKLTSTADEDNIDIVWKKNTLKRPHPEELPQIPPKEDIYVFTSEGVEKWPSFVFVKKLTLNFNSDDIKEERVADLALILESWSGIQNLEELVFKTEKISSNTLNILRLLESKPITNLTLSWQKHESRLKHSSPVHNPLEGAEEAVLELAKSVALREDSVLDLNVPVNREIILDLLQEIISTGKEGSTSINIFLNKYKSKDAFNYNDPKLKKIIKTLTKHPKKLKLAITDRSKSTMGDSWFVDEDKETFRAKGEDGDDWTVLYTKNHPGCSKGFLDRQSSAFSEGLFGGGNGEMAFEGFLYRGN